MARNSLFLFLQHLPQSALIKLFSTPCTSLGLLLLMPPLAQQLILRLLYSNCNLEFYKVLNVYDHAKEYFLLTNDRKALDALEKLTLLSIVAVHDQIPRLNSIFSKSLHDALVGGGNQSSFGKVSQTNKYAVTQDFLDEYSTQSWEAVLHYLVGTPNQKSQAVVNLLLRLGLMQKR
jgi:transcription initiation factor TFIIH subunit 4